MTDFAGSRVQLESREVLATNGLIHDEMVGIFQDMFAGRDLTPIPTPEEFAAKRARAGRPLRVTEDGARLQGWERRRSFF